MVLLYVSFYMLFSPNILWNNADDRLTCRLLVKSL